MTAITIRSKMVEIKGARLKRLSCHNAWNSTEWFFHDNGTQERCDADDSKNSSCQIGPKDRQTSPEQWNNKWNESVIIAIHNTE